MKNASTFSEYISINLSDLVLAVLKYIIAFLPIYILDYIIPSRSAYYLNVFFLVSIGMCICLFLLLKVRRKLSNQILEKQYPMYLSILKEFDVNMISSVEIFSLFIFIFMLKNLSIVICINTLIHVSIIILYRLITLKSSEEYRSRIVEQLYGNVSIDYSKNMNEKNYLFYSKLSILDDWMSIYPGTNETFSMNCYIVFFLLVSDLYITFVNILQDNFSMGKGIMYFLFSFYIMLIVLKYIKYKDNKCFIEKLSNDESADEKYTIYSMELVEKGLCLHSGNFYDLNQNDLNKIINNLKGNCEPNILYINNNDVFYLESQLLLNSVAILSNQKIISGRTLIDNLTLGNNNLKIKALELSKVLKLDSILKQNGRTVNSIIKDEDLEIVEKKIIYLLRMILANVNVFIFQDFFEELPSNIVVSIKEILKKDCYICVFCQNNEQKENIL